MILTDEEKRMVAGEYGPGIQKAMSFLLEYGEAFDAQRMAPVDSVHIIPEPMDWLSALTEGVKEVRVLSTMHAMTADRTKWREQLGIVGTATQSASPDLEIYQRIGCVMSMTCAPYVVGNVLRKGGVFSWGGSSGIIINNSLFGARGNRDSGVAMTCSAVTGRTPEIGRLRPEERFAEVLIRPQGLHVDEFTGADYGNLGYYIGSVAGIRNVVIDGLPSSIPFEELKYLLSPMPVSGAVSLCHIVGLTPEAPTLVDALGHHKPELQIAVGPKEMKEASNLLSSATTSEVDVVCLGCPHLTIREMKQIARLLAGKKKAERVRLWISTNEGVYGLAKRMGLVDVIEEAGGLVITDTCLMTFPFAKLKEPVSTVATNSARCAHYHIRGGLGTSLGGVMLGTFHGSTAQCINAALTGRWGD